ncbi:Protopine 6-monooxygenase [Trichinella spiralis]|uniref:Protopine 6-monooxygenase n=1 Tax=Trichinella spiralis TaxID=6334 RepID=A0ABR3KVU0_TRISP
MDSFGTWLAEQRKQRSRDTKKGKMNLALGRAPFIGVFGQPFKATNETLVKGKFDFAHMKQTKVRRRKWLIKRVVNSKLKLRNML